MIEEFVYLGVVSFFIFIVPFFRKIYFSQNDSSDKKIGKKNRYDFFDFLRGLAILAVVVIHVGDNFFVYKTGNQLFIKIINDIARFAVPFFFISSGILLLKSEKISTFYSKKIVRTFLPYFIMTSLVGLYYNVELLGVIYSFLAGTASAPYYFMSVLFQFYLVYPLLEKFSKYKYFLHTTFLISLVSFFLTQTWSIYGIPLFFRFVFLFSYGIAMRGRFLTEDFKISVREKIFWFSLLIYYLLISVYFEIYFYNMRFFYAIALFNLAFFYRDKLKKVFFYPLFVFLGKNSLWIYLIHYFVLQILWPFSQHISDNFYLQYSYLFVLGVPISILFSLLVKYMYNVGIEFISIKSVK